MLGVEEEDKDFIFELYLPLLQEHIGHIQLSILEKAELTENTIGSVIKLLYAFLWQEHVIDLGGMLFIIQERLCYYYYYGLYSHNDGSIYMAKFIGINKKLQLN